MHLLTLAALTLAANPTASLDAKRLEALVHQCEITKSDCLVVMVDGKVVVDKWFGAKPGRIEAMSATKSMLNLAIGMLIKNGKIKNVDETVHRFFPKYTGGGRDAVTIRHLLEHTSGIEARPDTADIYSSRDFVKNALDKPLTTPPGSEFFYNNRAVNLLAGVVGKAGGERLDLYLKRKILNRLGIKDYRWSLDGAGNPHGMAGFQVRPEDFAKIGEFVRNGAGGLLPDGWIVDSTKPTERSLKAGAVCGRLWWPILDKAGLGVDDGLLQAWHDVGVRQALIDKMVPLKGKLYDTLEEYFAAFREQFKGDDSGLDEVNKFFMDNKVRAASSLASGNVHSYSARGYLGQYLVIVPSAHLVAVRMRRPVSETEQEAWPRAFDQFPVLVDKLGSP